MSDRPGDGRHDFDFLHGRWRVGNHRRANRRDPAGTAWERFGATSVVEPVLGGLGHVDRLSVPSPPGGGAWDGLTLRLFDPATGTWRIWWAATTRPGHLDPAMTGRFAGGVGRFEGPGDVGGRPGRLRFAWHPPRDGAGPRWEQAWSLDGGATWTTDWTMDLVRADA